MPNLFRKGAFMLAAVAAGMSALPTLASAQEIIIDRNGPRVLLPEPDAPPPRRSERIRERERGRECTPDRALDKAEDFGLRRARIVDVGRRTIEISGRLDGERVVMSIGRGRNCPILDY